MENMSKEVTQNAMQRETWMKTTKQKVEPSGPRQQPLATHGNESIQIKLKLNLNQLKLNLKLSFSVALATF